jgi:hypothetical protein
MEIGISGRIAVCTKSNRELVIQTDLWEKVVKERKAETEKEKLKGF